MVRHKETVIQGTHIVKSAEEIQDKESKANIIKAQKQIAGQIALHKHRKAEPSKILTKSGKLFMIGKNCITNTKQEVKEYIEEHFKGIPRKPLLLLRRR